MKQKIWNNQTRLAHIVRLGRHDPLWEMMLVEAITRYAEQCSTERLPDGYIIDADAWQKTAKEMLIEWNATFK